MSRGGGGHSPGAQLQRSPSFPTGLEASPTLPQALSQRTVKGQERGQAPRLDHFSRELLLGGFRVVHVQTPFSVSKCPSERTARGWRDTCKRNYSNLSNTPSGSL